MIPLKLENVWLVPYMGISHFALYAMHPEINEMGWSAKRFVEEIVSHINGKNQPIAVMARNSLIGHVRKAKVGDDEMSIYADIDLYCRVPIDNRYNIRRVIPAFYIQIFVTGIVNDPDEKSVMFKIEFVYYE